jgi:polyisoprenoid-binding protein YceI
METHAFVFRLRTNAQEGQKRLPISEPAVEEASMKRGIIGAMMAVALVAVPVLAQAETMTFKLLSNYSRATFKSDAPLETFVGNTAAEGITGTLTVDPAKPAEARGTVKVDMNQVRTGIDKRDADMRSKDFIDTANEANRWVTFEVKRVEITGPLEPGKTVPAKVHGILTVRQKAVERVADATVTYIKLTPEQVEAQKQFGFTSDNIKVRAKMATTFTDHGMQVPQLLILRVADEIPIEIDLTFAKQ